MIMKTKSKKPNKQRKTMYTAPLHLRRKRMSVQLSKELQKEFKRRSLPVRKGDEVEVVVGKLKKKTGKVSKVDLKNYKVYIEGILLKRTVGTEVQRALSPSNLKIVNLNLDDEERRNILKRKVKEVKIEKPKTEKTKTEKLKTDKEEIKKEEKHGKAEKAADSGILEGSEKREEVGSVA